MKLAITLLLMLTACGASDNAPKNPSNLPADWNVLQAKRELYFQLIQGQQDEIGGFIVSDKCDSLLFTSLAGVGGLLVSIDAARDDDYRWYRRPTKDCYLTGQSKSSISKDMLLGLAWFAFYNNRADIFEETLRYGRANNYVMGEGPLSRTFMTPSLQAVYAEGLVALGGKKFEPEIHYPQVYNAGMRGYEAHLQVLNILLRARLVGGVSEEAKERISDHYTRNRDNGLFCYAYHVFNTGDLADCIGILLRTDIFPADRLPNSGDRCQFWLWEREQSEWRACDEGRTHSGGDFLFVSKLIAEFYGEH